MNTELSAPNSQQGTAVHPRPQARRSSCELLNGMWDFHLDSKAKYATPDSIRWDRTIIVPFSPETTASGIADTNFYSAVWYRRTFETPTLPSGNCLLLHFEAVDYETTVWVNGSKVCHHEGGYTPFTVDITDVLISGGSQQIIVRAEDDPADLAKPRGKQDWRLEPLRFGIRAPQAYGSQSG